MSLTAERERRLGDLETKARIMRFQNWVRLEEMPRLGVATLASQGVLALHVKKIEVKGIENLDLAVQTAQQSGKRIIFTNRHRADADTLVFRAGLEQSGYGHVVNNTRFIAGVNMLKRPHILPFSFAEGVIYIATPEDFVGIRDFLDDKSLIPLERERSKWVDSVFHKMNKRAGERVKEAIDKRMNIGLYPEGGRSYDGYMRRAPRSVSIYFPHDDSAVIVPIVINGTDEVNRPNEEWNIGKMLPENRRELEMMIGMPYSSSEVWDRPDLRKGKERNPADWVMANIANTYPYGIRDTDYLLYEEMIRNFRSERNMMSRAA